MISSTVETLEKREASAVVVKAVSGAQDKSGAQKLANARALYSWLTLICIFIYIFCMYIVRTYVLKYARHYNLLLIKKCS